MMSRPLVSAGAVGWDLPAWRQGFYPDGLPEDWLLSYYNTQFQTVFLPQARWRAASGEDWARWLDDTREDFVFVLEPGAGGEPPASPRVVLATPAWAVAHVWWLDEDFDLRALAQRIARHAATGEPLHVFSRSGDLARLQQVADLARVMGY